MVLKRVLLSFYIYLGYSRCLYSLYHEQGKQGEHLAQHRLPYDLVNAYTKYLRYPLRSDRNITPYFSLFYVAFP